MVAEELLLLPDIVDAARDFAEGAPELGLELGDVALDEAAGVVASGLGSWRVVGGGVVWAEGGERR